MHLFQTPRWNKKVLLRNRKRHTVRSKPTLVSREKVQGVTPRCYSGLPFGRDLGPEAGVPLRRDMEPETGVPLPLWTDKQTENINFPITSYACGKNSLMSAPDTFYCPQLRLFNKAVKHSKTILWHFEKKLRQTCRWLVSFSILCYVKESGFYNVAKDMMVWVCVCLCVFVCVCVSVCLFVWERAQVSAISVKFTWPLGQSSINFKLTDQVLSISITVYCQKPPSYWTTKGQIL